MNLKNKLLTASITSGLILSQSLYASTQQVSVFDNVPRVLIAYIFSYLDLGDNAEGAQVSKQFHKALCSENSLFQQRKAALIEKTEANLETFCKVPKATKEKEVDDKLMEAAMQVTQSNPANMPGLLNENFTQDDLSRAQLNAWYFLAFNTKNARDKLPHKNGFKDTYEAASQTVKQEYRTKLTNLGLYSKD